VESDDEEQSAPEPYLQPYKLAPNQKAFNGLLLKVLASAPSKSRTPKVSKCTDLVVVPEKPKPTTKKLASGNAESAEEKRLKIMQDMLDEDEELPMETLSLANQLVDKISHLLDMHFQDKALSCRQQADNGNSVSRRPDQAGCRSPGRRGFRDL